MGFDPIELGAHIGDLRTSLACHPYADRSGSKSILRLRTAKDEGAAKDNRKESRRRLTD